MRRSVVALVLLMSLPALAAQQLSSLSEAMDELHSVAPRGKHFSFTGLISQTCEIEHSQTNQVLIISDGTDSGYVRCPIPLCQPSGTQVRLTGVTDAYSNGQKFLQVQSVVRLGTASVPPPVEATAEQILNGTVDYQLVTVKGVLVDLGADAIDTTYTYLTVRTAGRFILACQRTAEVRSRSNTLVGAHVRLTGICRNVNGDSRLLIEHILSLLPGENGLSVIAPAPTDPFDVPFLWQRNQPSLNDIADSGKRGVRGHVLATWGGSSFVLRVPDRRFVTATLRQTGILPRVGDFVTVSGYPETDLFSIRLNSAEYRREKADASLALEMPREPHPRKLFEDATGTRQFNARYNGQLVRLHGTAYVSASTRDRFTLDCGSYLIPVEIGSIAESLNGLEDGCRVEVTGVCLLETDIWQPNLIMPRVKGLFLVPPQASDVRVLARPPWWTPFRLLTLIATLFALIVAISIWNRVLNRLVLRRSRELLKEQVASTDARLRVDERTRLAAELHDSLSQNLSAIACQVNVAKLTSETGSESHKVLETAERMLQSCRTELTRCLWDLRVDTLEEHSFAAAIRKTLDPLALRVELSIRFNVQRSRVSDSTAHGVLCIIRELVSNALRHGKATRVRIAGRLDESRLLFSVSDNGCGFDVGHHPGLNDGHFGLAGIQDRINRLYGTFSLRSGGRGTTARITLPLTKIADTERSAL